MNPSSSSSSKSTKTTHNRTCTKIEQRTKKRQHCSRNPLQDLNTTISTSSNNSSTSTSSSIEAPKGCIRFFLSHSSSSSSAKTPFIDRPIKIKPFGRTTPKSAPNLSKPSKPGVLKKPISQKVKKTTPCLYQWQSGRKSRSSNASKSKISSGLDTSGNPVNKVPPRSELRFCDVNEVNLTPSSKTATGSGLDFRVEKEEFVVDDDEKLSETASGNKSKTPPIQPSVSPEIQTQFVSSLTATDTTPACYGAGHVLSGITDKRKCRPKGILTVGDNNVLNFGAAKSNDSFDGADDNNKENVAVVVDNSSSVSVLPLPAEASMQWLLSPCKEEDEKDKENSEIGLCRYQLHSPSSDLFGDEFNWDLSNHSNSRSSVTVSNRKRRSTSLCSPGEVAEFQGILGPFDDNVVISSSPNCTPSCKGGTLEEGTKYCFDFDGKNSPFSVDILGSGNVILTPQSDSSMDLCVGLSPLKVEAAPKHHFDSELDLVAESLQMTSLSSKGYESIWDPTNSSFQFDCLTTASNSVDLSQFQKILDDRASWMSTTTLGNVSQSQMRISWREGLVSRIFEMDEFDSCRYLSDEEEDANCYYNDQLKSCQNPKLNVDLGDYEILKNGFGSTAFINTEPEAGEKIEQRIPSQVSCSCAESISTDGGGLAASGDSDWTLCYKNDLFKL